MCLIDIGDRRVVVFAIVDMDGYLGFVLTQHTP